MPRTSLNDLQKIIDAQEKEISCLKAELERFKKVFQSLKILVDMMVKVDGL